MALVELSERTTHYFPDETFAELQLEISEEEKHLLAVCIDLGNQALAEGNPPIGAVILNHNTGQLWGARTDDKTKPSLFGHAEIRALQMAERSIGDKLENCTLGTSVQPCTDCTPFYASGKIGRIVYAAPRWSIREVSRAIIGPELMMELYGKEFMRDRSINLHELLIDSRIDTLVSGGYRAKDVVGQFATWATLVKEGQLNA